MAALTSPTHPHVPAASGDTLVMWRPARARAARPLDETAVMGSGELGAAALQKAISEIGSAADAWRSRPSPADIDGAGQAREPLPAPADGDARPVTRPALAQRVGTLFVKVYRVAGFAILAAILAGLATYLGTHLFFLVNRSWVAPSILTPADPRVLGFASRFVEESSRRDALLVRRAELEAHRREAERTLAVERSFQAAYALAMRADLADRKAELARTRSMLAAYATARGSIASASDAFRASSEERLRQEHEAGVIDKDRMLGGNLQLAQIAEARLSLEARSVELQGRIAALSRAVDSLEDAASRGSGATSYEALKIRAELERSVAAAAKAHDEVDATTKSIAMIDDTIAAEERIIETMKRSAYHGIVDAPAVFAFVPYDNTGVVEGAPVYACRVGIVWCRRVGRLGKATEGEVVQKHPLLHQDMRGAFVRIEIDDTTAAESAILHAGRRPLFL